MDELYSVVNKAWQSKSFRPTVRFAAVGMDEKGGATTLAQIGAGQEMRRASVVVPGEKA